MFSNIMPGVRSEDSVVRYYCTAGNGMEPLLVDEVKRKLSAQDVSVSISNATNIHDRS